MVSAIAVNAGAPTAGLTGGQWHQKDQGQPRVLVGYLKVRPEHYTKLAKCSGQQAAFVTKLLDRSGTKPWWINS